MTAVLMVRSIPRSRRGRIMTAVLIVRFTRTITVWCQTMTAVWGRAIVEDVAVQIAGSVTIVDSPAATPGTSMSASHNVRHVPEINTSDGRNRAL